MEKIRKLELIKISNAVIVGYDDDNKDEEDTMKAFVDYESLTAHIKEIFGEMVQSVGVPPEALTAEEPKSGVEAMCEEPEEEYSPKRKKRSERWKCERKDCIEKMDFQKSNSIHREECARCGYAKEECIDLGEEL